MARGNSFEGGSNGVTITSGNSGGASGDALDTVDNGAGVGTVQYSSAQSAHGSLAMLVATGGTTSLAYGGYTLSSVTTDYMRGYFRVASLPGAVAILARYMTSTNQSFRVNIKAAGTLEIRDNANSVVGTTSSAVSAGAWFRLELFSTFSATVGAIVLRLYASPDSTTVTDSLNLSGLALSASATSVRYGVGATAANIANTWIDDIAVEGATWHGPAVRSITLSGIAVPVTTGTTALSQSLSVVPTGIAIPAAVGSTALSQAFTVTPGGIAVPLAIGDTAAAQAMGITPTGIAVATAVGSPVLSYNPPAPAGQLQLGAPRTRWRAHATADRWTAGTARTRWKTGRPRGGRA